MTAEPSPTTTAPSPTSDGSGAAPLQRLYLVRGVIALAWAAAFAGVSGSLHAGAVTLLLVYPAIDVAASLFDAYTHRASGAYRTQLANAALSTAAVIALAIAATDDKAAVLVVFGAWAVVSGLIQLGLALSRRKQLGYLWAMYISGAVSALAGAIDFSTANGANPKLTALSGYAVGGSLFFLISAGLLAWKARGAARPAAPA